MQRDQRNEVLDHLQQACCDAARGALDQVERHIDDAKELLDQAAAKPGAAASLQVLRSYLEDAHIAFLQSDALGIVLPLFAALQTIKQSKSDDCEQPRDEPKDPGKAAIASGERAHHKARTGSR